MLNHPADYVKIAVIAWASIFFLNRVLAMAGLGQFQATMNGGKSAASS
jgi:hypothetical protein